MVPLLGILLSAIINSPTSSFLNVSCTTCDRLMHLLSVLNVPSVVHVGRQTRFAEYELVSAFGNCKHINIAMTKTLSSNVEQQH